MASPHRSSIHPACSWFLRGFCIIFLPSNSISQPSDRTGAFQGHQVCSAALHFSSARQPRLAEGTGLPGWAQGELHSLSTQLPPKQTPQTPFPGKSPQFVLLAPFYHNAFCHNPFLHKSVLIYKLLLHHAETLKGSPINCT